MVRWNKHRKSALVGGEGCDAGACPDAGRKSGSTTRHEGGSTKQQKRQVQPTVAKQSRKRKVSGNSEQDSRILTCNESQWKYFLRSGHWRLPGEAGIDAWKHCNVDVVEEGNKRRTVSLKVAVQPKGETPAGDGTVTTMKKAADEPPFEGFSRVRSLACPDDAAQPQCSDCQSATEVPAAPDTNKDFSLCTPGAHVEAETWLPSTLCDTVASLSPSPSHGIHHLLASPNEADEEEAVAALLQTPDYN